MKSIKKIFILFGFLVIINAVSLCVNLQTYGETNFRYLVALGLGCSIYIALKLLKTLTGFLGIIAQLKDLLK